MDKAAAYDQHISTDCLNQLKSARRSSRRLKKQLDLPQEGMRNVLYVTCAFMSAWPKGERWGE